jgi:replicative DNA helicase
VLGSILLLPIVCDDVAVILRPEDFYDDANRAIYAHVRAMHDDGGRVDTTLLVERLKSQGDFERIGGPAYLAEIIQSVPTAANAVHYAEIVRNKSTLRSLIHSSTEILRDAYDESIEPREMLNRAEQKIFAIVDERASGQVLDIYDVMQQALGRIDARMQQDYAIGGIPTGLSDFDRIVGGLHDSELAILAARPAMGKTSLALNVAEHVAVAEQLPTLFVSLEMSRFELAERLLCSRSKVDLQALRNNSVSTAERQTFIEKSAEISQSPLFIDDTPSRTMTEIAATARRLKRRQKLRLVVIDYLQLIEPDNPKDQRQEQVAKVARRLKGLARELQLPVLCLAQLNRQAEITRDNKPRLSHLRESGAIEQDADMVMFVHREEYYETDAEEKRRLERDADLIVAKNRNGATPEIKLQWRREYTRFDNAANVPHEAFADWNDS